MLYVAYTDEGHGTYFGGVVVNPSVMKKEPAGHVQVWSIVALTRPGGPITRLDSEVIAISQETYNDLVVAEKSTFWPTYNAHRLALEQHYFQCANAAGVHSPRVPSDLAAEIHLAAERAAHRAIEEESRLSTQPAPDYSLVVRQMIEGYFAPVEQRRADNLLGPLDPNITGSGALDLRPKSVPATRRRSIIDVFPPSPTSRSLKIPA